MLAPRPQLPSTSTRPGRPSTARTPPAVLATGLPLSRRVPGFLSCSVNTPGPFCSLSLDTGQLIPRSLGLGDPSLPPSYLFSREVSRLHRSHPSADRAEEASPGRQHRRLHRAQPAMPWNRVWPLFHGSELASSLSPVPQEHALVYVALFHSAQLLLAASFSEARSVLIWVS